MKKILSILIATLLCCYAEAQTYYYLSEESNAITECIVLIKDKQSNLWIYHENPTILKNNLMEDVEFYTHIFNESQYLTDSFTKATDYSIRHTRKPGNSMFSYKFFLLTLKNQLSKCYVYNYNLFGTHEISISLDFSKIIHNSNLSNYTTFKRKSLSDLNIRKSQDDLF